ncbi:unnamed protein product [Cyprideis torosa]|uniref:Uncharacterized protein n=1 Tax=Cyprideis torosa TaxID=163714 RepID=A0A7R8ZGK5_9CRUS|nr:unnamed protein product [Cyprideis torosa]CAG0881854.1 unnamed protein product [Cyprideis torosa]
MGEAEFAGVENFDAFKKWLKITLKPINPPDELTTYIVALVRKNRPLDELRQICLKELGIFLGDETTSFVDVMFDSFRTKAYLKAGTEGVFPKEEPPSSPLPEAAPAEPIVSSTMGATEDEPPARRVVRAVVGPGGDASPPSDRHGGRRRRHSSSPSSSRSPSRRSPRRRRRPDLGPPVRRGGRGSPVTRRRSRSPVTVRRRSPIVSRRSRSPPPVRRSRSPPPLRRGSRSPRRSRSPVPHRYPPPRSNAPRSFSPPDKTRVARRSRSPRSRSPSPFPEDPGRSGGASTVKAASPTPSQTSTVPQPSSHSLDTTPSLSATDSSPSLATTTPTGKEEGTQKKRCRDFDENGLCMRGDLCPFDHGSDPVVLENLTAIAPPGVPPPYPPPSIPGRLPGHEEQWPNPYGPQFRPPPPPFMGFPNPPFPPNFLPGMPLRGHAPPGTFPGDIPIPGGGFVVDRYGSSSSAPNKQGGGRFDYSRLGTRKHFGGVVTATLTSTADSTTMGAPPGVTTTVVRLGQPHQRFNNRNNCSLEIKKIPRDLNDISHINDHFSKFGRIVNIQVQYGGDPETAVVTFSSPFEATRAMKCPEAVLNNRFVKVFWHTKENSAGEPAPVTTSASTPVTISQVPNTSLTMTKALGPGSMALRRKDLNASAEKEDPAVTKQKQIEAIQKAQEELGEKIAEQKKAAEKKKEAQMIQAAIRHRKQEMITEALEQQKRIIGALEEGKGRLSAEERKELLSTCEELSKKVALLKLELALTPPPAPLTSPGRGGRTVTTGLSRQQIQKELLDAELELTERQRDNAPAEELRALEKRIFDLKRGLYASGTRGGGRGRGRGSGVFVSRGSRARGRYSVNHLARGSIYKTSNQSLTNLDKRPKRLLISGFESDEREDLLRHFMVFADIMSHTWDMKTPSAILGFATRSGAEKALKEGKVFKDRVLSITWYLQEPPKEETFLKPPESNEEIVDVKVEEEAVEEEPNGEVDEKKVEVTTSPPPPEPNGIKVEEKEEEDDAVSIPDEELDEDELLKEDENDVLANSTEGGAAEDVLDLMTREEFEDEEEDDEERSWRR